MSVFTVFLRGVRVVGGVTIDISLPIFLKGSTKEDTFDVILGIAPNTMSRPIPCI